MQGFHQDLFKIFWQGPEAFSQGIVKDLDQDLHARTPKRIPQDRHKRICWWRGARKAADTRTPQEHLRKAFIKAPLRHRVCKIFTQALLKEDLTRISTRSPDKDLCKIMLAPLRKDFTRICTRSSHKDLCKIMRGFLENVSGIFTRSSHIRTCSGSNDLWQDFIRIFTTSSHKDLYKTLAKIFLLRLHHETLARSS